jgi:hypothetical protein
MPKNSTRVHVPWAILLIVLILFLQWYTRTQVCPFVSASLHSTLVVYVVTLVCHVVYPGTGTVVAHFVRVCPLYEMLTSVRGYPGMIRHPKFSGMYVILIPKTIHVGTSWYTWI